MLYYLQMTYPQMPLMESVYSSLIVTCIFCFSHYQFLWMDETDTVSSITMLQIKAPSLLVLDPQTQYFYLCPRPANNMTVDELSTFLSDITENKIAVCISALCTCVFLIRVH